MTVPTGLLLAIDTATTESVAAIAATDGRPIEVARWSAGYRHGETLLPEIDRLLTAHGAARSAIAGVIVGTGPGAFTGLRVGIATAKGIAHGLACPIVGVSTGEAILEAAARVTGEAVDRLVLLLPAGPSDRIEVRVGGPARLLPAGEAPVLAPGETLVAIDLRDRAPDEALATGERARDVLADELLRVGAARLAAGEPDDLARLVPEYVTLPRGAGPPRGEMTWSRDHR